MSAILLTLTVLTAMSAAASLVFTLLPGFSDRTAKRTVRIFTATAALAGLAHLAGGDPLSGAMLIGTAILLLSAPHLGRWVRTRQGEKAEK